ncbi:MAG: prepilin-type N-terminal cleavage/methylation domain-containing protein [Phycisphaerales bacterium]|nr:prepilin-type N-terminal cleavage/methylation domain-containing protein [Phycisphaerales bacterium]
MKTGTPARARGFTLLEILLVVVILTVLAALLFVAIGAAVRSVRKAGEQQYVRSLAQAVEQYRQSFGALPPLVADGPADSDGPLVVNPSAGPARPRFKGEAAGSDLSRIARFLRYELDPDNGQPASGRYSVYTLPVYVLGVLGKRYDGADGPGFTRPDTDGVFSRSGPVTQPLFDVSRQTERLVRAGTVGSEDDPACRTVLVDRWGRAIRYYAWLPTLHKTVTGTSPATPSVYSTPAPPGNNANLAKEVRSYNVPPGVGNPLTTPELRSARAAVVSAGPDGLINDTDPDAPENKDNIVEVIR